MRLDDERPSDNIEDRRGQGGGFRFPGGGGGRRINFPMGGRGGGFSLGTIVMLVIAYFAVKLLFGIDLLEMFTGGGGYQAPGQQQSESQFPIPGANTNVSDAGGEAGGGSCAQAGSDATIFVKCVLGSTERVWSGIFQGMGRQYEEPKLVLFENYVQSACGMAQSAMGPFYCPGDQKVYIDLAFYQDMKTKLGSPGDFAQAYVVAHEVGHHIQNLWGIADKVQQARMQASEEEGNALSVRMELQADCLAGIWAKKADATKNILQEGDIEEGLNAAAQIGDDRLQKRSQGYVVPESFTHGSSEQRVRWFKTGLQAEDVRVCDTFGTGQL